MTDQSDDRQVQEGREQDINSRDAEVKIEEVHKGAGELDDKENECSLPTVVGGINTGEAKCEGGKQERRKIGQVAEKQHRVAQLKGWRTSRK